GKERTKMHRARKARRKPGFGGGIGTRGRRWGGGVGGGQMIKVLKSQKARNTLLRASSVPLKNANSRHKFHAPGRRKIIGSWNRTRCRQNPSLRTTFSRSDNRDNDRHQHKRGKLTNAIAIHNQLVARRQFFYVIGND